MSEKQKQTRRNSKGRRGNRRGTALRFVAAVILFALALGLMELGKRLSDAMFPAYRQLSQNLMSILASATSVVEVAVWDIAFIGIVAVLLVLLVIHIVRRKGVLAWLSSVCVIVAALFLFMTASWGLNHYSPPLSEELDLQVGEYSADELVEATQHYFDKAVALAMQVPRNEEDASLEEQDFNELAAIAGESFSGLSQRYGVFDGSTVPVKKLSILGTFLLYTGHNGIISPFTGEASVPEDCAVADMPFTMCHEVSHRCGIASEQEANFAAFLAGSTNEDVRFRYSAYLKAFQYCYSALANNYPGRVGDIKIVKDSIGYIAVAQDINNAADHYDNYEGPLEDIGSAANDTYLKAFSEAEGIRSYGLVVDYLIAWDESGRGENALD